MFVVLQADGFCKKKKKIIRDKFLWWQGNKWMAKVMIQHMMSDKQMESNIMLFDLMA